jgi:hypothetical protein
VRFEPDDPGVGLLAVSGAIATQNLGPFPYEHGFAPVYRPLCDGPCTANLSPGSYRLALAKGGRVVPVSGPVVVSGPATLRGQFIDRSSLRAAGLALGVAGAVGGFVMIVASAQSEDVCNFNGICFSQGTANGALLGAGVAVLAVSAIVGSILTFQHDAARITVEPLVLPARASREGRDGVATAFGVAEPPSQAQGAAIALHF